uniref:Uncharacterized protein n=1 Tax=Prolemur simus TaxID=1328070 RepID=A0A8C8ZU38_PROSS
SRRGATSASQMPWTQPREPRRQCLSSGSVKTTALPERQGTLRKPDTCRQALGARVLPACHLPTCPLTLILHTRPGAALPP